MSTSSRIQSLCDAVIDLDHTTLASLYFPKIEEYPAPKKLADEAGVREITATAKKLAAVDAPETVLDIVIEHEARLRDYITTRTTLNVAPFDPDGTIGIDLIFSTRGIFKDP